MFLLFLVPPLFLN